MILVTAFEPFGEDSLNSSFEVLKELQNGSFKNYFKTLILPVTFAESWSVLSSEIQKYNPSVVLLLGQARGRDKVNLERLAINLIDCEIPDNKGQLIQEQPIGKDGADALFTDVLIDSILEKLRGLPVKKSFSAGAYVCNYIYYKTLESLKNKKAQVLFIHLPILPEQALSATPSLDLKIQVNVLEKIIEHFSE